MYNIHCIKDEAKCQTVIREMNFRETPTQFVYRGSRGMVIIDKEDDRVGAYLHFINKIREEFDPTNLYHMVGDCKLIVPDLDVASAQLFLSLVDDVDGSMTVITQGEQT